MIWMQENSIEPSKDRWEHCSQSHQCLFPQEQLSYTWLPHLRSPLMWIPHLATDKSSCGTWSHHSWLGKQRLCLSCIPDQSSSFLVHISSLSLFPRIQIQEGILIDIQHSNSLSESELQQWGAWGQALETSASNDDILVKENMFSQPFSVCVCPR